MVTDTEKQDLNVWNTRAESTLYIKQSLSPPSSSILYFADLIASMHLHYHPHPHPHPPVGRRCGCCCPQSAHQRSVPWGQAGAVARVCDDCAAGDAKRRPQSRGEGLGERMQQGMMKR